MSFKAASLSLKQFQACEISVDACIFDMDGVLCDTMPFHLQAWEQYVEQTPELAEIDRGRLTQMGGKRNSELLPELLGRAVSASELHQWARGKEAVYRELIRPHIQLLPGLIPFLEQVHSAGIKIGLGTSACQENADLLMGHQSLGRFFAAQVVETDVQQGKPDPQCYLLVAERLGVTPQNCIVFEDAIAGVQSACNANMICWGVLTTQPSEALIEAGAVHCIEDFNDPSLQQLLVKAG
ncbi:HAD-IA family hydrolase [Synechococcales cyanobacterium C]|uniref:HAD-IA family hydrolase n=1 Tax=Petrachloros mirabilis ULC683 TaxID=2781853 RepID=A0A8K2A8D6_9CYAN|nr:HAD family phosphatase [Petrachloros mirabilis]NCJ06860.1 HAD-IA family hydrolase [Petrachloros mirabilis ULC683]